MTMARAAAAREQRATIEDPTVPITDTALVDWLNTNGGGFPSVDSGVSVTPKSALGLSTVWRAVNVTSAVAASLPLKGYVKADGGRQEAPGTRARILTDPHPEMTRFEFWRLTYAHRYLWGNFYGYKHRAMTGEVGWVEDLAPERMKVGRYRKARNAVNPTGKLFAYTREDGSLEVFTPAEILHIPGFGYDGVCGVSPVRAARQAIGLGLAAEKSAAKLFGSGTMMSGILQTEQRLDAEQSTKIKEAWRAKVAAGNPGDIAVVDNGAKFESVTMPYADAQFLESRQFQVAELERFLGVPPFLMFDTEKSTSWGTGLEQQATGWVQFDLGPNWLTPTEQRLTRELLRPDPAEPYAEYTVDGLMRGDSQARAIFYRIMREVGALSANDIRRLENEPPVNGGDVYLQPLNLTPLGGDVNAQAIGEARDLAEIVQKMYLGVGVVLTADEARQLLAKAGFPLSGDGPFSLPGPQGA